MDSKAQIAVVYGVPVGSGGLGIHAANILTSLAPGKAGVHAFGPGRSGSWPMPGEEPSISWHQSPRILPPWVAAYTPLRWYQGRLQLEHDSRLGRWAAIEVERLRPQGCYLFTQIGLETLEWARREGISTVLDNPNGHLRDYYEVCRRESVRWCGRDYLGHPNSAMVERVEKEYQLADRIRVSSEWAKNSMIGRGVPAEKISVVAQPLNLLRFQPCRETTRSNGPLRVCYVGSLSLHKGFIYLLRAIRILGAERFSLEVVGATGDRWCRRLLEREQVGLLFKSAPGDPVPAYHRAEVFVLPSLGDGFGFVVAEAMACGLPVIVTDQCGAAELVRPGETGWIVKAGQTETLTDALENAYRRRKDLASMGQAARAEIERRAGTECLAQLRDWFLNHKGTKIE